MNKMTALYRKEVETRLPEYVAVVRAVALGKADLVLMTLDAFVDDPVLLYKALWYAGEQGARVEFAPEINLNQRINRVD